MNIKTKALSAALGMALVMGLAPAAALAATPAEAAPEIAPAPAALAPQADQAALVSKAVNAANALPAASKLKLSDNKKLITLMDALADRDLVISDLDADQVVALNGAFKTYKSTYSAMGNLIAKETKKTEKAKVSKVKVKPAKKKATVSWKKLGSAYKYQVFYSAKKGSGFKKAGTTSSSKLVVKKLKSGKKYYFKVRGVRNDIPTEAGMSGTDPVYTKYSAVVAKKVK